jgi:hypothetical protein
LLYDSLSSQIALFQLATFCSSRQRDSEAIWRYEVKIDISCEIFLNATFSSEIARFELATLCSSRKHDFEAIFTYEVKIDISYEILLNDILSTEPNRAFSTRYIL